MPGFSLLTDSIIASWPTRVPLPLRSAGLTAAAKRALPRPLYPHGWLSIGWPSSQRFFLGACGLFDVAIWVPIVVLALLLLLAWGGVVFGFPGIVAFWVIQQYVLGFRASAMIGIGAMRGYTRVADRGEVKWSITTGYLGDP